MKKKVNAKVVKVTYDRCMTVTVVLDQIVGLNVGNKCKLVIEI